MPIATEGQHIYTWSAIPKPYLSCLRLRLRGLGKRPQRRQSLVEYREDLPIGLSVQEMDIGEQDLCHED